MAANSFDLPVPGGGQGVFQFMLANPDFVGKATTRLNKLGRMQLRFTSMVGAPTAGIDMVESDQNMILPLPQCPRSVALPSGGATVDAEMRAAFASLMAGLRQAGYVPSS